MGQHRQRIQRRVELVERLGIAADTQDFHIGHKHEEGAGQDKTDHDGAGYRLQRILCFIAESGGAFEADETEDRDHNAEANARPRQLGDIELRRVDCEVVLGEHKGGQDQDQGHRDAFEEQHQERRELHILPCAIPGYADAHREQQDLRRMQPNHFKKRIGKDGEAGCAGDRNAKIGPDQGPAADRACGHAQPTADIGVHRPGGGGTAGELIEVVGNEHQHDGAQRVGQPAPIPRVRIHHRDDQGRRHGGRDQRDCLRKHLAEVKTVRF